MISPARPFKDKIELRITDEYTAHMFYRLASNWCENMGYDLAAKYYAAEADSELQHAQRLQKYLVDSGVMFRMPTVLPTFTFNSLFDIIDQQYELEADLYTKYEGDTREAFSTDISAYRLFSEFTQIQYDSVAEVRTLKDKKALLDPTDKLSVFLYEKEVYE